MAPTIFLYASSGNFQINNNIKQTYDETIYNGLSFPKGGCY